MIVLRAACFMAFLVFSGVLHAQSCSGGTTGGMDVTGNECDAANSAVHYSFDPGAAVRPIPKIGEAQRSANATSAAISPAKMLNAASYSARAALRRSEKAARIASLPARDGQRKLVAGQAAP